MDELLSYVYLIPIILFTITIHEFAHGKVAQLLGDPTPKLSGRLSLNPLVHLDPIGFLMLIIVKFGWAKPVPINPNYFKDPEKDMAFVGLAGPFANFFAAWACSVIIKFIPVSPLPIVDIAIQMLKYAIWLNLALGIFNLLPVPPLDGSRILRAVLPYDGRIFLDSMEPYGFIILIFILLFPGTSDLIIYLVNFFFNFLL